MCSLSCLSIMTDTFGLGFRRDALLRTDAYVGCNRLKDILVWQRIDNVDYLCLQDPRDSGGRRLNSPTPGIFTFVAVASSAAARLNKLSGVGDYHAANPKPLAKLKWVLHFTRSRGTPFQEDWDAGISVLQHAQHLKTSGVPNDMIIIHELGAAELRTTSRMFKPKSTSDMDAATRNYIVPAEHRQEYIATTR
ncbi:uncharacterized protein EV420DRAFT_204558 [Desarmillaria tabescens]|uniref:Uncharacterized protein n=1 Tax=Armillaria tabescens TaxID=1929756 RepID=A0AA39J8D2_ARMTA|nr:uncharacterized protein EV420DRAFT_204558 [Desarmillaria tabescens]KAK0437081.1 hypothetical protein EV420DRAFT_204558 [Desarmillaria tabescens]